MTKPHFCALGALLATTIAPGCTGTVEETGVEEDAAFLSVPKGTTDALSAAASGAAMGLNARIDGADFYLAIHKSQLGKQWFMTANLEQFYPGLEPGYTVGTRVVSFEVQNGQLLVMDASDARQRSDSYEPQAVIIDAYPIIEGYRAFMGVYGWRNYVLFDPAHSANDYFDLGNWMSAMDDGYTGYPIETQVAFLQRFRELEDGISYDRVFAGAWRTDDQLLNVAGTLGLSIREYSESPGFEPFPRPYTNHFFTAPLWEGPYAGRWAIEQGMEPITWTISSSVLDVDQQYPDYDIVGAIRRGVEGWNDVFGFTALRAEVDATEGRVIDDEKNMLLVDADPSMPYAFADWRINPNTSEVRGASVFFSSIFIVGADMTFTDPPIGEAAEAAAANRQAILEARAEELEALAGTDHDASPWKSLRGARLCEYSAKHFLKALGGQENAAFSDLTKKEKVERHITHVVAHEIGHTLGLRHNFMGSTVPPSVSVMDYLVDEDSVLTPDPQLYDHQAIRYLYGLSEDLPTAPFCTDGQIWPDPYSSDGPADGLCNAFDFGADPLMEYEAPYWEDTKALIAAGVLPVLYAEYDIIWVHRFAWLSTDPYRAFDVAMNGVGAGSASPLYDPALVDDLARIVLKTLVFDTEYTEYIREAFPGLSLPADDSVYNQMVADAARDILVNLDEIRSFESRRAMVDVLEAHQTYEALVALRDAQSLVELELEDAADEDVPLVDDLLARIEVALSPYYDN
jgi:hypothetical protein